MLEDRVFSLAESSKISDKFTAVKMLGGNDLDDEGKAFMKRYDVGGYPTLLAMTADGAVVARDLDRTVEGIVEDMDAAVAANDTFKKSEAELSKKTDAESLRTLAGLYKERSQLTEARARYETLTKKDAQVEDQEALLEVLGALDDGVARKALLKVLVDTHKDSDKNIQWRMEYAMADLPTQVTTREEFIAVMGKRKAVLEALLPEVKKTEDQAAVRGMLANILTNTGERDAAAEHIDWILANAPKSEAAAGALWVKSNGLIRQAQMDGDPEKAQAGKALWEQLVKDHADTRFGQEAARVMPQLDGLIKMLAAKKAEAEKKPEDEKDPEEDKDGDK